LLAPRACRAQEVAPRLLCALQEPQPSLQGTSAQCAASARTSRMRGVRAAFHAIPVSSARREAALSCRRAAPPASTTATRPPHWRASTIASDARLAASAPAVPRSQPLARQVASPPRPTCPRASCARKATTQPPAPRARSARRVPMRRARASRCVPPVLIPSPAAAATSPAPPARRASTCSTAPTATQPTSSRRRRSTASPARQSHLRDQHYTRDPRHPAQPLARLSPHHRDPRVRRIGPLQRLGGGALPPPPHGYAQYWCDGRRLGLRHRPHGPALRMVRERRAVL